MRHIIKGGGIIKKLAVLLLAAFFCLALAFGAGRRDGLEREEGHSASALPDTDSMTLSEKVWQMMIVTPESITSVDTVIAAGEVTRQALSDCPVGGIIYFADNLKTREQTVQMLENTQSYSKIPLFLGVDEEGGLVSRAGSNPEMGVTRFGPMAEVENEEEAYQIGKTLGTELSALGFNVDFAPVADVLVNPDNTEIGNRSFGSNPEHVAEMVAAQVRGFADGGVLSVLKHFPGHGSTSVNSHNGKSESARSPEQLAECELIPFKAGISAGADFVMASHMTLSEISDKPASLSYEIMTELLKNTLGFEGIAITDSLSMGAVTDELDENEAAVLAIEAGADMLLMPKNPRGAHDAVMEAIGTGRISEERIDESVRKILKVKEQIK